MKKMMMILIAVAAIGFTACNKTNTEEQKAQTEQTDGTKADEKAGDAAAQEANKADNAAATTDAKADVKADEKTDK